MEVEANNPTDATGRESIRVHLTHIAKALSGGNLTPPRFSTTPCLLACQS